MMLNRLSLRYRIALIIFVLEACMLAAVLGVTLRHSAAVATSFDSQARLGSVALLTNLSLTALLTREYSDLQLYISDAVKLPAIDAIVLADSNNRVVAGTLVDQVGRDIHRVTSGGNKGWEVHPVNSAAGRLGTLAIRFSDTALTMAHDEARDLAVLVAAAGMLLIAMVGIGAGFSLTRRLEKIETAARRIAAGETDVRSEVTGHDEIASLATSVNRMADAAMLERTKLEKRNEQVALLLSSTVEGIYGVDANGVCTFANESCVRLLGYASESELVGKSIHALIHHTHPDGRPYPKELCRIRLASLQGEQTHRSDEVHWRADGSSFPIEYWSHPIHENGVLVGTVVTFIDITERKRAEEAQAELERQLLQSQKMESIGHLTGGIAHDFNNMLGAMLGYAELGREMLARPGGTERVGNYLREILAAGTRAKELIAQMLVFSRLSPAQQGGVAPPTLLQPVVKEVSYLLRSSIPATIELEYRIEDESLQAIIQPVQLHQVILNLGINARDAIGEYGRIEISVGRRETHGVCASCSQSFSGSFVELQVKDSGHGIPEGQMAKIFDPFFTTKDVGKGTGMGLSVVHGIVHGVGGHITVDSRPGEGTTIRILLPAAKVGAGDTPIVVAHDAAYAHPGALAGLHILVVDDEQAMGSMLQELLSLRGATVTAFDRPVEALAAFMRDPAAFDLVITDEAMPDLSGMDMARVMLKLRPDLPIILCTGYSEHATPESARAVGIKTLLQKPLDIEKLVRIVAEMTRAAEEATT